MTKPKIAIFDFAGCEGDELQIVNLEENLLDLLGHVELVSFREGMKEHSENYDIAFIEGSCTREQDEARLKEIRKTAKLVVALGSCAAIGGINCLKNHKDQTEVRKMVYGDKYEWYDSYEARPIDAVIPVDAYVYGCPIDRNEFLKIVKNLLMGKKPDVPNYPICVECKLNGNVCAFERGQFCVGPVTRAGCNSACLNENATCWGCRGAVDNPNTDAHMEVLEKYGLNVDDCLNKFRLYFNARGPFKTKEDVR